MSNLEHIDLTQGRRFDDNRLRISSSLYTDIESDIHRRLKKGQIPHKAVPDSYNETNTRYYNRYSWNVTNDSTNTITFTSIPTITATTWNTTNSFDDWFDSNTAITVGWNGTDSPIIYYSTFKPNPYLSTNNDRSPIESRIKNEPFNDVISNRDMIRKLREYDYYSVDDYHFKSNSIKDRLYRDDYDILESDIIDRLEIAKTYEEVDKDDGGHNLWGVNIIGEYSERIELLKKRAPFIKRVYVTNGGHSFDNKELDFDMVLAKEHFDEYTQMLEF